LTDTVLRKGANEQKCQYTANALVMLTKAIVYESCKEENTPDGCPMFLFDQPLELEKYLIEFVLNDGSITIVDGPAVSKCAGYGYGLHNFLLFEGEYVCSLCSAAVCHFCINNHNTARLCFECFRTECVGVGNLTELEMREELLQHEVMVPSTASYRQIMLLYDDIIDKQRTSCFWDKSLTNHKE